MPRQFHILKFGANLAILAIVASSPVAVAQSITNPQPKPAGPKPMSFAEQYALHKKVPLIPPQDKQGGDGKPLSVAQLSELEKSNKLFDQARQLRNKGDYEGALKAASECLKIRNGIYKSAHYLTVYAISEEKTLRRYAQSAPDELNQLAESDRQQNRADDAYNAGEYATAIAAANRALATREQILGRGHHELGECYRVIGASKTELNAMAEAEDLLAKAVDVTEKAYGKGHPVLAKDLDRQGWLYINKGDALKAQTCLQTAVRIYNQTCGDTLDAAEAIDNLGTALLMRGDPQEGLTQKLRSLVIREAVGGPLCKDVGVSYSNLAWLYVRLGAEDEVIPLREKALAIFEKALGPEHSYTSTETVNLGVAYQNKKRVDEAIVLYKRAVDRDETRKEPPDARLVSRLTRLGVAYFEAGKRDLADTTLQRSVEKARMVKDGGNLVAAAAEMQQIAEVYDAYRMLDQNCKVLEEVCHWDTQGGIQGEEPAIRRATAYAHLLIQLGRGKDAKQVMDRTVMLAAKAWGRSDLRIAPALLVSKLADESAGDLDGAEKLGNELLKLSESKTNSSSKQNAIALREMGRLYMLQKRYDLARFSLDDARKITEKYQEDEPLEMVRFLQEYADLQFAAGEKPEAAKTLREALGMCRKLYDRSKTPHMEAVMAKTIKKLIDADASATDRDALRGELKSLLAKLQANRALDADNKVWLKELGESVKG